MGWGEGLSWREASHLGCFQEGGSRRPVKQEGRRLGTLGGGPPPQTCISHIFSGGAVLTLGGMQGPQVAESDFGVPLPISLQVLGFVGTLPTHTQHLLFALCHFFLPGHGDAESVLWPGVWASWWGCITAHGLPSLFVFGLTWERWGARGVGGMAAVLLPPGAPGTLCPVGPQPSLTWPSPPGGGGGALVPPKRPGNPAPVCRAQAGSGRAGLGEDALLPGGRLEWGQLPADQRGDSARGRTCGCEVGECVGATPVGPSASPSPLSITHLGRWAAVARRRTEDGTEAILIVVKSTYCTIYHLKRF